MIPNLIWFVAGSIVGMAAMAIMQDTSIYIIKYHDQEEDEE